MSRGKIKVLYICHNHPKVRPGGAEMYALELHRAMRESDEVEPTFVAKGGPPVGTVARPHQGTMITTVDGSADEYFLYTDGYTFDWLNGTITDKEFYTKHVRQFLRAIEPDVVHIQHTLFLGYDLLREIHVSLPNSPIVYTLHEFLPICHRDGQMLRTADDELCLEESPRRCHECFPNVSQQDFFLRKRFIQSHLSLVDVFIAPSRFLLERFVEWGIPRKKIHFEDYGRSPSQQVSGGAGRVCRDRFAYFGQLNPFKGVHVALEAMAILNDDREAMQPFSEPRSPGRLNRLSSPRPQLAIHGANLDVQDTAYQERFWQMIERTRQCVTFFGKYEHSQLPKLMEETDWVIVPSRWWENSPLVIQEAFNHGRPVLCSNIGGMAEKVVDEVNGLHFMAGSPVSLARTISRAATTPGLWDALRSGIPPVHAMDTHVKSLTGVYQRLLASRASG